MKNQILTMALLTSFGTVGIHAESINIPINGDREDAEQFIQNGKMYINSSDLELGADKGKAQLVGLRFKHVDIPKDARVTNAYIQFTVDEKSSEDTYLKIYGEKKKYSSSFSTEKTIISRKKTNANIEWAPEPWVKEKAHGENQRTPDLSAIIEEIRAQTSWNSAHTVGIIIEGTGRRTAESYSGSKSEAPILHIEYTTDANPNPSKRNSVGDFIWEDSNKNGVQDNGERGIDGMRVHLLNKDKTSISTTTTKNGGKYIFTDIADGKYYVKVDLKDYSTTKKHAIEDGKKDSNAHGNGRTYSFKLSGNRYDNSIDIGLYRKNSNPPASWCDDNKYTCVTDATTLTNAVKNANDGDTIIIKEGTYNVHHLEVKVPNVTIASQYYLDKNINHIKNTILKDSDIQRAKKYGAEEWLIDGGKGDSENLSVIGLSITHVKKGIGFHKGGSLVDHCRVDSSEGSDAISFENVLNGGGEVRYTFTYSDDEGVDLDTAKGNGSGLFNIHHNYFKGDKSDGDDLIEMRIMTKGGNYEVDIHDNLFDSAHGNAMQFIDYGAKDKDYLNKTTIKIHHNIIKNSNYSGIDATLDKKSARVHEASPLAERISIYNNYFYNNGHHIDGGYNMHIKNNIFDGNNKNTKYALAWVEEDSTIKNNLFFNNKHNYKSSNHGVNDIITKSMDDVKSFAKNNNIKLK